MMTPIFPPIPESTARSARAIYGRGNPYLYLGDRLDTVLSKFDPKMLGMELHGSIFAFLALLTIIQFSEDQADNEFVESVQSRPDIKYALHLPDPSLRLSPIPLCLFRQTIFLDPGCQDLFVEMFQHIYPRLRSRKPEDDTDIEIIVKSICVNTIRASLIEAMLQTVEALSANQSTWFRQIAKPFWYERYSQIKNTSKTVDLIWHREITLDEFKADIQYLLQKISQLDSREVNGMDEIKILKRMWDKMSLYEIENNCHACLINRSGKEAKPGNPDLV